MRDRYYIDSRSGESPFLLWLRGCTLAEQAAIDIHIGRLKVFGLSYKQAKALGDGLWELKINKKGLRPLRVYFSVVSNSTFILFGGSGKQDQSAQIANARQLLERFKKTTKDMQSDEPNQP